MNSRENVNITWDGTKLVITVETDPAKVEQAASASGKSLMVGTTGGARKERDLEINLNVYRRVAH